mmetsp:Transcript_10617/g.35192  ORF Transcript_10617/g.35192 Transcript_10617/m.35192 type:complete len:288 (+) Transcript_10617:903-1766(+)
MARLAREPARDAPRTARERPVLHDRRDPLSGVRAPGRGALYRRRRGRARGAAAQLYRRRAPRDVCCRGWRRAATRRRRCAARRRRRRACESGHRRAHAAALPRLGAHFERPGAAGPRQLAGLRGGRQGVCAGHAIPPAARRPGGRGRHVLRRVPRRRARGPLRRRGLLFGAPRCAAVGPRRPLRKRAQRAAPRAFRAGQRSARPGAARGLSRGRLRTSTAPDRGRAAAPPDVLRLVVVAARNARRRRPRAARRRDAAAALGLHHSIRPVRPRTRSGRAGRRRRHPRR